MFFDIFSLVFLCFVFSFHIAKEGKDFERRNEKTKMIFYPEFVKKCQQKMKKKKSDRHVEWVAV